jgi:hypothetical protein
LYKKHKLSNIKSIPLLLICLLIFIRGLQIPTISTLTNILLPLLVIVDKLFGWQIFSVNKSLLRKTRFVQSLGILTLFCIIYWNTMIDYNFLGLGEEQEPLLYIVGQTMRITFFYIIGFLINYTRLLGYPYNTIVVMSSLVGSTIFYSFLSIQKTLLISPNLVEIKSYLDYWTEQEMPGEHLTFALSIYA